MPAAATLLRLMEFAQSERVKADMRKYPPSMLSTMTGPQMKARFKAGPTLCLKAKKAVLSESHRS
jgi:hypothetical protein